MKTFVLSCVIMLSAVTNAQSLGLRAGHSLTPADHLSLRYEHWTNSTVNFALGCFFERNKSRGLNYSCYGLDLLAEYASSRATDSQPLFGWRGGLGATWQLESEPWLYKDIPASKRINYGLAGEGAIECYLSEVFRLSLFASQKYLLRPSLGSTRFCWGLGLTYNFPGY